MKTGKKLLMRNEGYSLIELIVSILIMSIIMGAVIVLLATSRMTYEEVSTEARLQTEMESVRNFISEIALETKQCKVIDSETLKTVWFYAPDYDLESNESITPNEYCYYFILHYKNEHILRYAKVREYRKNVHEDGSVSYTPEPGLFKESTDTEPLKDGYDYSGLISAADKPYSLLAQYVDFIDLEVDETTGLITVELKMQEMRGKKYEKSLVFAGRNMKKKTE